MDFVDRASSQLKTLYGAMTPAARLAAGLLVAAVLVGLGYLGSHRTATPDTELMRGVPISASQLALMEAAIARANLTDYEIRGASILVPRGREAIYMAALAKANALPPQLGDATSDAFLKSTPFMSSREREELLKKATQDELSLMIRSMNGIETAYVIYDVDSKRHFGEEKLITASVSVKPVGTTRLDEARVSAIRHLVSGAIAGLKPENVTVSDLNGSTWHGNLANTASDAGHTEQSPVTNHRTDETTEPREANHGRNEIRREATATEAAAETSWTASHWGKFGLIGLGAVGLLVMWSIVRGASAGNKRTVALHSAHDEETTARSSASVVPAPHWKRTPTADRSVREELSQLVDDDPEAAANILRNWIGQAS